MEMVSMAALFPANWRKRREQRMESPDLVAHFHSQFFLKRLLNEKELFRRRSAYFQRHTISHQLIRLHACEVTSIPST